MRSIPFVFFAIFVLSTISGCSDPNRKGKETVQEAQVTSPVVVTTCVEEKDSTLDVQKWIFEEIAIRKVVSSRGEFLYAEVEFYCHEKGKFRNKVAFFQTTRDIANLCAIEKIKQGAEFAFCIGEKLDTEEVQPLGEIDHNGLSMKAFRTRVLFRIDTFYDSRKGVSENLTLGEARQK